MKKISGFIGKYMAIIVLVVAALALFVPKSCLWIQTGWINYLLMLVIKFLSVPRAFFKNKEPQSYRLRFSNCQKSYFIGPMLLFTFLI